MSKYVRPKILIPALLMKANNVAKDSVTVFQEGIVSETYNQSMQWNL